MGCRTGASGIKSSSKGPIILEPKAVVEEPVVEETVSPCQPQPDEIYGCSTTCGAVCSSSCSTGLPLCPPDLLDPVNGQPLCPPCLPPDAVMIAATPRDPYYVDDLARALDSGDQTRAIRVTVEGNIPLVRPVSFRHAALPGSAGVPNNVRSDIETHELEHQAINMYATIPQESSERREVAVVDRFNNRWVIINSVATEPRPVYRRLSPSHFSRGRGTAPWWKTGYPDGTSSTGVG